MIGTTAGGRIGREWGSRTVDHTRPIFRPVGLDMASLPTPAIPSGQ